MSLTAANITELMLVRGTKAILAEWLASYFDGSAHAVGLNAATVFPSAGLAFAIGREPAEKDTVIRLDIQRRQEREWMNEDAISGLHKRTHTGVTLNFWVKAKVQGKGQSEYRASTIADLLKAILTNPDTRFAIAERGITRITPTEPVALPEAGAALYLVSCGAELHHAVLFDTDTEAPVASSGDVADSVGYIHENPIVVGDKLLGVGQWGQAMVARRVTVYGQGSPSAPTVFELFVASVATGVTITLAQGVGEQNATASLTRNIASGAVAQWRCVSGSGIDDAAYQIALGMEVEPA